MFPDFTKMQADAASALKRAEERHVESLAMQRAILIELQHANRLSAEHGKRIEGMVTAELKTFREAHSGE